MLAAISRTTRIRDELASGFSWHTNCKWNGVYGMVPETGPSWSKIINFGQLKGVLMINVHVIDRRVFVNDPNFTVEQQFEGFSQQVHGVWPNDRLILVNADWRVQQICTRVHDLPGMVEILRIYCHGNASNIILGTGMTRPADTQDFRILRGHFIGRKQRIELHSCAIASATEITCARSPAGDPVLPCTAGTDDPNSYGRALVQAIADNAQVLTIAALNFQNVFRLPIRFAGRVVYCEPDRNYIDGVMTF